MVKKLLLIDDSISARYAIKGLIPVDQGFDVFEATNGREGLALFTEVSPDIVLLDITMPIMDGYDTLEAIRQLNKEVIVVILTADNQNKTAERVIQLGATSVMRKPPNRQEFAELLMTV